MTKKNTKKALAMAAAAAAVTGGTMAVTSNVHADTINPQSNTQNQTQKPQASDLKTQQDTSRQAYADTKQANTDAQSDLAQASAKNTAAQGNVDSAQTDVETATQKVQSATTAEQNTQAEVTQAQTEANKAQNDYDNAVKQQVQTDQAVQQAQSDLKTANQAVIDAQKAADQANAKQAQAQTNANTANQNVENTNTQVQKAQGDVNDAQASVKNAENDVQTAQSHDQVVAQEQSNVQAKTDAKNKADAKVNDAQKVNDEKSKAQSNAQAAVNDAQKTVDQLSKDTSAEPVENALATSQEWINTLKEAQNYLLTHNNTLSPELDQKLSELGSKIKYQKQYQSDPTLKNQKVKYNNDGLLSNQDEIQITKFALSLINPIREQLGMPALTITQNALKIANNVANTYNRDNWIAYTYTVDSQGNETPIMKGHDVNAFKNDINASNPANTGASSEAMTASEEQDVYDKNGKRTGVTHYIAPTMDDLYARIYGGVADMLFTDSNMQWGHTYTLLGMGRKNENQTNNIGVQTDRYGQIHYVLESSSQNDHSNLINVNNNDASQAYQDLLNAEDNYKKFINDHQNDDLNFSDMVSEQDYKDDKASYDADPNGAWAPTYKATVDQYNKQRTALKPYLDAIDQAQTKLDQVYFAKTSDSSKTDGHAVQLASAKKALQNAQAKLETAKQEASQASADLASAKAEAQHAADELKAAQDKLAHDSGSSMSLADAQAKLKNAKAVLAQKQVNLADAKKAAQKAQTMKSQSDSALASAKQEAQTAQKALANAQAKAKSAQEHVDALTSNDHAVADAKDNLNAANQKLQVAKSNHEAAQDNLTKAQNELKQAQTKLENAKDEATKAANALKNAQMKADKTKNALAKAKDNLITDSKVYGNSVAIKDQTIHTGEINKIVDPEIANPMAKDPTQSLVMGTFLQMAASKLDTIPTGTTAKWNQPQNVSRDANLVGDHSEDVLVTFPDGSTTTVKMGLHVLAAVKPSQPDTPAVNPGHDQTTTPTDPTDQPGHNVKPGDTTKPATKPSTEPSTTPSHEEQQPGTHTDTPTAKPSDQQPATQPSGDEGQSQTTTPDHKATVNDNSDEIATQNVQTNATQTAITATGHDQTTTPTDPTDQPGHNVKPGDTTKPATKPSTEPSTTPSHEEQQPGTHTDTPTAKPSDQQPATQPSGDEGQSQTTTPDHKATVNDNSDEIATQNVQTNATQTAITATGHDQTTTPTDPTDQPGHNVKPGDTTKPATKPSTEPSTTPSHEEQQPGTHTDTPTAKPSDQQPATQPSGDEGQSQTTTPDHKATVNDNSDEIATQNVQTNATQTAITATGHDQTTTPTDPTDQPGHNVKPGDTTKPATKPSTEPSTTPSHEEQQPGTHTDTPTAKPSDQQPATQPSGDEGQSQTTTPDHKATVNDNSDEIATQNVQTNATQTAITANGNNDVIKIDANGVENSNNLKRSDLNNGRLPQTGNTDEMGLIGLSLATMASLFGIAGIRRKY